MKCPICGAGMRTGECIYCKISAEQVKTASNKKAKQALKEGRGKEVYYSRTLPSDVSRKKLLLLTIFLGLWGGGYFYVGKYARAWTVLVVSTLSFAVGMVHGILDTRGYNISTALTWGFNIAAFCLAVICILWIVDTFAIILRSYTVPVILGEEKKKRG